MNPRVQPVLAGFLLAAPLALTAWGSDEAALSNSQANSQGNSQANTKAAGLKLRGDRQRGREVFREQGRCLECHRHQGEGSFMRGPSFDPHWKSGPSLAERLSERPKPADYGEVVPGDAYLLESLVEPGAYLTPEFEDSMPPAHGPLTRLKEQDLADLLAYLNPAAGEEPLRPIPALPEPGANPWDLIPEGDPEEGERLFFRPDDAACSGCHLVRLPSLKERFHQEFWEKGSLVGPELSRQALYSTPKQVLESILRPNSQRTGGFWDVMLETEGERLIIGLLLAEGDPGALIMEASPAGPDFIWIDRESIAAIDPVADSRMTHVFAELMSVQDRLDLLAFLRRAAEESANFGEAGLPGQPWGAQDPCRALYDGRWPEKARPELLQQIPGIFVDKAQSTATPDG
ncbi:MAG: hypothetical protein DWQ01_19810 [Planctomycetota bacterium]|nr:MAG: hypothetical protein DWQ01_19810 [Planctomycetota bacterium]